MALKIAVEKKEKYTQMVIHEDKLITTVAPDLKAQFVFHVNQGERNIVLDMSDIRYCDSSGLSAILVGNRLCKNANGTFVLSGVNDAVMKLIHISQLESVLNIVPKLEEAVDMVLMEEIEREVK